MPVVGEVAADPPVNVPGPMVVRVSGIMIESVPSAKAVPLS